MKTIALARRLRALSDPTRLRIVSLLPSTDECDDVYNVSELAREVGVAQPTVSHHLAVLREAGLVKSKRMCQDVYYWVDRPKADALLASLRDFFDR